MPASNKSGDDVIQNRPRVTMSAEAADLIDEWIYMTDTEIGGLGYADVLSDGSIHVDEVFLLPQIVSGSSVGFAGEALLDAVAKAAETGNLDRLRFSWHSHANFGVFWSNVDEGAIDDYLRNGAPWLLSLVANRKGETLCRIDVGNVPLLGRVKLDRLPFRRQTMDRTAGAAARAFDENVTVYVAPRPKPAAKKAATWIPKGNGQPSKLGPGKRKGESEEDYDRRAILHSLAQERHNGVYWKQDETPEQFCDRYRLGTKHDPAEMPGHLSDLSPHEIEALGAMGIDLQDPEEVDLGLISLNMGGFDIHTYS